MKAIVSTLFLLLSIMAISQEAPVSGKFKIINAHDPVSRVKVKIDLQTIEVNSLIDQILICKRTGVDTIKVASAVMISDTNGWIFRGSIKGCPQTLTFMPTNDGEYDIRYDQLIYKTREK